VVETSGERIVVEMWVMVEYGQVYTIDMVDVKSECEGQGQLTDGGTYGKVSRIAKGQ
jgi:hypothetical protein